MDIIYRFFAKYLFLKNHIMIIIMIYSFLPFISSLTNAQFIAQGCNSGVSISGSTISDSQVKTYKSGKNIEVTMWGSYCPSSTTQSAITFVGYPLIKGKISDLSCEHDKDFTWGDCSITADTECNFGPIMDTNDCKLGRCSPSNQPLFYGNRCYPYELYLNTKCATDDGRSRMYIGSSIVSASDSITCTLDDCLPNYWNNDCSGYDSNYNENKHCTINSGKSGDGKCLDCTFASEVQKHCRPSSIALKAKYYKKEDISSEYFYKNELDTIQLIPTDDDYYYSRYKIEGYIIIPKEGKYKFQLKSYTSTKLIIDGNSYGTIDDLECNSFTEASEKNRNSLFYSSEKEIPFSIELNNCSS